MTEINKRRWLVSMAVIGTTAAVVGAGLFWLVLTRPVAVAAMLGQVF